MYMYACMCVYVAYECESQLDSNECPDILLDHVELVFLAYQAPDDSDILDDHIDGYRAEGAKDASYKPEGAKPVQRERLYHAKHVHIDVESGNEGAQKVDQIGTWDWVQAGKDHVRRGQGHRHPRVDADAK